MLALFAPMPVRLTTRVPGAGGGPGGAMDFPCRRPRKPSKGLFARFAGDTRAKWPAVAVSGAGLTPWLAISVDKPPLLTLLCSSDVVVDGSRPLDEACCRRRPACAGCCAGDGIGGEGDGGGCVGGGDSQFVMMAPARGAFGGEGGGKGGEGGGGGGGGIAGGEITYDGGSGGNGGEDGGAVLLPR